jgi:Ca2+-binding EF-hand superfamily protein
VIRTASNWLVKNKPKTSVFEFEQENATPTTIQEYFTSYDMDHDGYLTPGEFRKACQDFKEPMLKQT